MRAVMYRLRSLRFRSNVLPLVLAALVLRALIPTGFMPGSADGAILTASMCSTQPGTTESIDIPGAHAEPHCEYCVVTPIGAAPAIGTLAIAFTAAGAPRPAAASQTPTTLLARAQTARAPPSA